MSGGWGPAVWVLIVGSGVLALALPLAVSRMIARRQLLEDLYLSTRPGVVLGSLVALGVSICFIGIGAVVLAIVFPFIWATAALSASGVVSVVFLAVAFVRTARRRREKLIADEQDRRVQGAGERSPTDS